ncbi:carbohydrate-binding protein [Ruthenibacterium sp.]|jgi:hypothetical protein|uniref:carbohydrate-binding protein n=1 Tax=Ruthenibacterium sp. TaxID=1905345 RepID=UPI00257A8F89|nr:carbohydrate-binding protein [Ruthenibacterium sp.]MBQ1361240.1 carbohydrate-binding protein [Ruthenibacterium sp.]
MQSIKLKILDAEGHTCMTCKEGESVSLVYTGEYRSGDRIVLECREPGCFCVVQFEDTLTPAYVYVAQREISYQIPFGLDRIVFSPKAFTGARHLVRARLARPDETGCRRNLALNPFDQHGDNGFFPHAIANVETRGEAVFAAYNAIDGIGENASHGEWPYQSWGINRDPQASWTLNFGRPVTVDELRVTLRADFPHDSWWTKGTVDFSDGSSETLHFEKTAAPQSIPIAPRTVTCLTLHSLIKADDSSPFPALTQFEAWGREAETEDSQRQSD